VVIAAHDEAPTIGDVVRGSRRVLGEACEVIVVDDGSRDGTAGAAREAGAHVVRFEVNRGKGAAMREGIARSRGEWLVFLDADGQDDPEEIPKLLARARGDVAMVNGSRFLGTFRSGAISGVNFLGNVAMTALLDLAFLAPITDSQAGFRAVRGDLARALDLTSTEYEFETEMLAKLLRRGLRVIEVPVTRERRRAGTTDFRRIKNGLRIAGTIVRERLA
jgi:glycosyltransferase involved in cell wall biosynthesis